MVVSKSAQTRGTQENEKENTLEEQVEPLRKVVK